MKPISTPTDPARRTAALAAVAERRDWFHVGAVRSEADTTTEAGTADGTDDAGTTTTRTSADVYVYDVIGGGFMGVDADAFVRDVAGLDVDHLDVHLNSPGGSAYEGIAIANVLRQHRADVTVWVDGIAASAASVVAMAGDEVVMSIGAQLMIHDAWTWGEGNAADMRRAAAMLDSTSDSIAATYAARAGGTAADWRAVMLGEAWYTAEQAVAAGLADRVATTADNGSAGTQQITPGGGSFGFWDMWDSLADPARHTDTLAALYARDRAGTGQASTKTPAAAPAAGGPPAAAAAEGSAAVEFTPEQITTITEALGIASDSDAQTITDAVVEALDEQANDDASNRVTTPPKGTLIVDEEQFAQLREQAAAGATALARQEADDRRSTVAAAVRAGKIPPARAEHWEGQLKADPGASQVLDQMPAGLVPVDGERGHGDAPDLSHDDAVLAALFGQEA